MLEIYIWPAMKTNYDFLCLYYLLPTNFPKDLPFSFLPIFVSVIRKCSNNFYFQLSYFLTDVEIWNFTLFKCENLFFIKFINSIIIRFYFFGINFIIFFWDKPFMNSTINYGQHYLLAATTNLYQNYYSLELNISVF